MPTLICYSCDSGMAMGGALWDDRLASFARYCVCVRVCVCMRTLVCVCVCFHFTLLG